jgi:hypothetical protein
MRDYNRIMGSLWWEWLLLCAVRTMLDVPNYLRLHRLHGWLVKRAYDRREWT